MNRIEPTGKAGYLRLRAKIVHNCVKCQGVSEQDGPRLGLETQELERIF